MHIIFIVFHKNVERFFDLNCNWAVVNKNMTFSNEIAWNFDTLIKVQKFYIIWKKIDKPFCTLDFFGLGYIYFSRKSTFNFCQLWAIKKEQGNWFENM